MKANVQSHSHIRLTYITHFFCDDPGKIKSIYDLLENFSEYPSHILDRTHFVIVDDGSPITYEPKHYGLNLTWLCITDEIPWNNPGARNLGATYAKSENIVISDTDHYLPPQTMDYLCSKKDLRKCFYKFHRSGLNGEKRNPHANLFFIARSRFMKFFGYDEEFCGHYAHDDVWFAKFQKWNGSFQRTLSAKYPALHRKVNGLTHTHSLVRDHALNTELYHRKRNEASTSGSGYGHSRTFLDFEWKTLMFNQRPALPRTKKSNWRKLWWFRALNPFS
jgi:hypothetical protein